MKYREMVAGQPLYHAFETFVGSLPTKETPDEVVLATNTFFLQHFGETEFAPANEDKVLKFCQWGPAGNYGWGCSTEQIAARYPGWTAEIDEAINAAWEPNQ